MSRSYQQRPSALLGLSNPIEAYYLDRGVMHFGSALEDALQRATNPNSGNKRAKPLSEAQRNQKTMETLSRWLGKEAVTRQYRDPAAQAKEDSA
jgi:hypothetical protein